MKVTLINPGYFSNDKAEKRKSAYSDVIKGGNMYFYPFEPPLGLASIYSYLSASQHEVNLIDIPGESISETDLESRIKMVEPDIIGITAMTPTLNSALKISKQSKSIVPKTPIVIGGVHPTVSPKSVLSSKYVDYVIRGEGEFPLEMLLETKLKKSDKIQGVCGKNDDGTLFINKKSAPIQNLDILPKPDYHSFPAEKYIEYINELRGIRAISMMVSRGCPYNCSFCAVHQTMGKKWRSYSPENAAEYMKKICKELRLEGIWFKDSIFNINSQWTNKFANRLIIQKNPYKFQINTRVDLIIPEQISILKDAGLTKVDLGIESGSEQSLQTLNKGITIEQIYKSVKILKKANIKISGFFMIGIPGETEKDIERTFSLARNLELDSASVSIFTPLPGSNLYENWCRNQSEYAVNHNPTEEHHFTESNTSYCEVNITRLKALFSEINNFFSKKDNF